MLKKKPFAWLALIVAVGLMASACGSSSKTTSTSSTSGQAGPCPTDITGDVVVSGSSTVEPISSLVGERLLDCGSGIAATVDGPGTGDGFTLFCKGDTDISDASRLIKPEEAATCAAAGIKYVELKIGFDGITVLTNPANKAVECLSFADLYSLIGPESDGFKKWSDAQALDTELGSKATLPDAPLTITAPGAESGTYDSFIELAFKSIATDRAAAGKITEAQIKTSRKDYASQADDSAIIAAMEAEDTPLGWVGFAFAQEAAGQVKELKVSKDGTSCIAPTKATIADGSYPLSRSLYLYVNAEKAAKNPAVAGYVDYYLSAAGISAVSKAGYIDLPADQLAVSTATWKAKTTTTTTG